jgi:hypothetical protein
MEWSEHWAWIEQADPPRQRGQGSIQWKGTDVCMDISCECGARVHIDADFFYYFRCPECDRLFHVGTRVTLTPLPPEHVAFVEEDRSGLIRTAPAW